MLAAAEGQPCSDLSLKELMRKSLSRQQFIEGFKRVNAAGNVGEVFDEIRQLPGAPEGTNDKISFVQWMVYASPTKFGSKHLRGLQKHSKPMTDIEANEWNEGKQRLFSIASTAAASQTTSLLVDAEQWAMQPAITYMTNEVQQKFNSDRATVYGTTQTYLRNAFDRLEGDILRAKCLKYKMGVKLVRGAYMESERQVAQELREPDPINSTLEDTSAMFDKCVDRLFDDLKNLEVQIASHNEQANLRAIRKLSDMGVNLATTRVSFAQLLGMADHITLTLGKHGFRATKYLPYGPIKESLPYLLRRAAENSALVGSATRESRLIRKVLGDRIRRSFIP
eukprot:GHVT01101833.1.p1 GENE.GHVT01101833.1~~GHVT01101833.1.p1  ORF type:complete len:338 (+),score=26.93 GHVT01101833.1:1646-2659(+)